MEFGKISVKRELILMGMVWLLTMAIIPSSAVTDDTTDNPTGMPVCWAKIDNCQKAQTGYDLLDSDATFSPLCCPVVKQQMKDQECFCSIKGYILSLPHQGTSDTVMSSTVDLSINQYFDACEIAGSFQDMCKDVKSESNKIASIGLVLPVAVLLSAMVVSD